MADPPEPDLDERFSLHPMEGEEVLERLLGAEEGEEDVESEDQPEK